MYNFEVVIDPGHGGSDPGAVSGSTREKDLTLTISQYMYDRFKTLGVPVAMTRSGDTTLSPSARVNKILDAFGNRIDVVVISNHINSSATGTAEGAEVIYALRNDKTLAENVLNALGNAGQKTRSVFQKRLPNNSSKDYYFIHRDTGQTEPIIIEYGFINNPKDLDKMKNNYLKYVDAVVDAVIKTKTGGTVPSGNKKTYTVKSGDSLYKIARSYGTTVDAIKRLNNLKSDNLKIGQILLIPEVTTSIGAETYTVKSGDSLWSIALKYNTSVNELKSLNGLSSNNLSIGQVLKLPSKLEVPEVPSELGTYTVVSGDTLWKLANKFNTNINEIKRLNNLSSDNLAVGQILIIPNYKGSLPSQVYTVRRGDSLWSIANSYNTTPDAIKKLNNLTSDILMIGQNLKIPVS